MYQLRSLIANLEKELKKLDINESIELRISNIPNFDFQINNLVKFQNSKDKKEIKKALSKIIEADPFIKKFEFTENYFVNLECNLEKFIDSFENVNDNIKDSNPKTIILDYGGPNIGKPLHVGHLRSLNIGRSLYEINKLAGHSVFNDIHLGDWGMPIAQIICYIDKKNIDINDIYIEDLEKIYPEASSQYANDKEFNEHAKLINKQLNENEKELIEKWDKIKKISVNSIKKVLEMLHHKFDIWNGESDVNNLIPDMLVNLKEEKKISVDKGAYVSNLDTDPKILITKSDGSYLYLTTDLATVIKRRKDIKMDKTLYIVDKRQKLHFEQLFSSIEYFQLGGEEYTHVEFGTVNDARGNPFKTRDGDTKKLVDLFDETFSKIKKINKELDDDTCKLLTNTVLTFSDLISNRMTDYKFDLDKFTNISGKTGIYVQYAFVRANKLLENSSDSINDVSLDFSLLDEEDLNLIKCLIKFEYVFKQALNGNEPHHLADYLYELSNHFNSMYQSTNILENKNIKIKFNKLKITSFFVNFSKLLMESLGIKPAEKM
tara:strand:- start:652 stop:2295 length:1644 start_codon:yes stop_codon:yes gene_type:complete